jgi:hypothetical protein
MKKHLRRTDVSYGPVFSKKVHKVVFMTVRKSGLYLKPLLCRLLQDCSDRRLIKFTGQEIFLKSFQRIHVASAAKNICSLAEVI